MDSYSQQYGQPTKPVKELNPEEIQHLFNKLSSDETKELREMMKSCTTEVTLTRGLPLTALLLGSLYLSRTRLPAQYHFGPKGWPFYAILGIGSLTASNMIFMGTCKQRIMPKVQQFWDKYQAMDNNKMTYEQIRQQHRAGLPIPESRYTAPTETTYDTLRHEHREHQPRSADNFIYGMPQDSSFSSYGTSTEKTNSTPSKNPYNYRQHSEEPSFMSGTPAGQQKPRERDFS